MNDHQLPPDFGSLPADMKMLETLISEMHGNKRGYVSEKIKHYQELLKRQDSLIPSDNDVVLMQALSELNSDLTMTSEEQWVGQPLGLLVPDLLNCMDMEFLPEVMSKPQFTSDSLHLSEQHLGGQSRVVRCHRRERWPRQSRTQAPQQ